MKIIVAPNAFKGSLTAREAADRIAAGVRHAVPNAETVCLPLSDGGDGFVEVLAVTMQGRMQSAEVRDPLGRARRARYFLNAAKKRAIIEMAEASGLVLLATGERNPLLTSTCGTGDLILHAMNQGARDVVIGIGGSATCDGGAGMAAALGARFLNSQGAPFEPTGGTLLEIDRIETDAMESSLSSVSVQVICDVDNPLLGNEGAARVYAPQKGAGPAEVELLEEGLSHLARIVLRDTGKEMRSMRGGGAAGGLGAGLHAFTGARLCPGADLIIDLLGMDQALDHADLVITGEGSLDKQSLSGKIPGRMAERARRSKIPCIALVGIMEGEMSLFTHAGFTAVYPLCGKGVTREKAMKEAGDRLTALAEQAVLAHITH